MTTIKKTPQIEEIIEKMKTKHGGVVVEHGLITKEDYAEWQRLAKENATLKKQADKMRDCLLLFFKSFNPDGVTPEEVRQKENDFNEFLLDAKKILAESKTGV